LVYLYSTIKVRWCSFIASNNDSWRIYTIKFLAGQFYYPLVFSASVLHNYVLSLFLHSVNICSLFKSVVSRKQN